MGAERNAWVGGVVWTPGAPVARDERERPTWGVEIRGCLPVRSMGFSGRRHSPTVACSQPRSAASARRQVEPGVPARFGVGFGLGRLRCGVTILLNHVRD